MVRYIKDGAYTIVVNDENSGQVASNDDHNGDLPTSSFGIKPPHSAEPRLKTKEEVEREFETIDYTSPEFILKNLSIATPTLEEEVENGNGNVLTARRELANIITQQIVFYCYCLLQVYRSSRELPTILLFGDGFIGTSIIQKLQEVGCQQILKIFTRGEYGTNNWIEKGFMAGNNLTKLLDGAKPDIIIFSAEYTSYSFIYHLIAENHLIKATTAIIVTTLGFQRKKVFKNFAIPTIFRAFVEPQEAVRRRIQTVDSFDEALKELEGINESEEQSALLDDPSLNEITKNKVANSTESKEKTKQLPPRDESEEKPQTISSRPTSASSSTASLSVTSERVQQSQQPADLTLPEKAASFIFRRIHKNFNNLIFLLENYFAFHGMSFKNSRLLALRCVFGYGEKESASLDKDIQEKDRAPSIDRATLRRSNTAGSKSRKNLRRQMTEIDSVSQMLVTMFSSVVIHFQRYFSTQLPIPTLLQLTNCEELVQRELLLTQPKENGIVLDSNVHNSDGNKKTIHEYYVDAHGRHHLVKHDYMRRSLSFMRMHSYQEVYSIFEVDEDYSEQTGAGFDFMKILDQRDFKLADIHSFLQSHQASPALPSSPVLNHRTGKITGNDKDHDQSMMEDVEYLLSEHVNVLEEKFIAQLQQNPVVAKLQQHIATSQPPAISLYPLVAIAPSNEGIRVPLDEIISLPSVAEEEENFDLLQK